MKKAQLVCTGCKKAFPIDRLSPRCDACNEPVEVENVIKAKIIEGDALKQTILEKYREFFPFPKIDASLSLGEGFTSLTEAKELAAEYKIGRLLLKNETRNPTWSFKDRGTAAGVQNAVNLGYKRIGTMSTGNMAASVAAYGARAGLQTFILVNANIAPEKLKPIAIYNPVLVKVNEDYGDLYFHSLEIGKECGVCFINSDAPFRVEGTKTVSYEICEQLYYQAPDYVIMPTSSGGGFRGVFKGLVEFHLCGFIDKVPKMIAAQAIGCSPICNAFSTGAEKVSRVENPHSIAGAIVNPYPPSGNEVLRCLRRNGGTSVAMTDEEILAAQRKLAGMGIFAQPAGATPLAAVEKLSKKGFFTKKDTVVCIVTGSGLKVPGALEKQKLSIFSAEPDTLIDVIKERL